MLLGCDCEERERERLGEVTMRGAGKEEEVNQKQGAERVVQGSSVFTLCPSLSSRSRSSLVLSGV